jgi:hypothetical protein
VIARQKIFDATLDKSIDQIKRDLSQKKFQELGITLSKKQLRKILAQAGKETFTIELEDAQVEGSPFAEQIVKNGIKLDIPEEEIRGITKQFLTALQQAIPAAVQAAADVMLKELKRHAPAQVNKIRSDRDAFKSRLHKPWKKAFEILDLYLAACNECGSSFNKEYRQTAAKEDDFVFDVVTRLQARGCQIGLEVMTLLEGGFADGAHARWRTLHEIACVAMFVKNHGQEVAERYLLHDIVETCKATCSFEATCEGGDRNRNAAWRTASSLLGQSGFLTRYPERDED